MKLSILIPVYNAESYIEKCLESLIKQDISESVYEIIVINDGSTDVSLDIIENFSKKHENILVFSQENSGAVFTRNKLMTLAKGDYIYFVDADDYLAHNSLAPILDFAISNHLDIMGFNASVINSHETVELNKTTENKTSLEILTGPQFLKENKDIRIEIWWYLIRKDFLDKSKIYFDKDDYDGDVVFTLRLFLKAKKVAFSPIQIYHYFQSLESTMRTKDTVAKKRIVDYFVALIVDFSTLIKSLDGKEVSYKDVIKNNFKFRRDAFTFFTISKMIKANLNVNEIKANLDQLEAVNAYPTMSFISEEYNGLKYKLLNYIFNHKALLFFVVKVLSFFKKG